MTSVEITSARQYVEMMALLAEQNNKKSPYTLLAVHGMEHKWSGWSLPRGVRRGRSGYCFKNAYELAANRPDKYRYVEGIAQYLIPTAHAWCVTVEGEVVDPTWRKFKGKGDDIEPQYLGIAIKLEYVIAEMLKSKVYGVLFNYAGKFPMLSAKPEEWRA